MKVYLDNAATTYPKPDCVYNGMMNYMKNIGASSSRGAYCNALESSRLVYNCRKELSLFFNFPKIENVIFTPNVTTSLNILLKSVIKDGWHIITSSMEHNSVLRPLNSIEKHKNIEIDIIQCNSNGLIPINEFKSKIKHNTKLVILSHASNIIGTIQPLEKIGEICKNKDIYFIIDSAQTAGNIPLDFNKLKFSALAFTGHKSLIGPQGIGGFLITDELNNEAIPFIEGGTGSESENPFQPSFLPDKFESGTLNTPGIAGLYEGLKFIKNTGINYIKERETYLFKYFLHHLLNLDFIKVYGHNPNLLYTPTMSINLKDMDSSMLSFILDRDFGIATRSGLHCAPLAHKTIGSFPSGTVRFSIGFFNTMDDINYTINSLIKIYKRK
ncbi:aminotransferase class V-fold PLP-dependent enzyme [Clostridium tetanomorphum]|uniref:cysteine desulfurase n=1 Tax=Clostridium tetanomorphum TaxID=1553 RepID=A0A923J2Q5_CLOTT|nr:aminotransferase class V-fold PLP-dependent enzyme [Clostridium tetanomorphum]MBC2398995.1 aminotransferase class V-fold PLP-dependent enzyme [Clostridium tetanomorphum]